jgi:hypothetical protein
MLPRHYVPRTPIHLLKGTQLMPIETDRRIGLLALTGNTLGLFLKTVSGRVSWIGCEGRHSAIMENN